MPSNPKETLKARIIRHVEMSGPLPVAEYMHWCMADAKQGYYQHSPAIGEAGDFITAPEISQMFGELIGVWAINAWQQLGQPDRFNLVEFGPGKGTLMSDLLRAGKTNPRFAKAAQIHLIETSPPLIEQQAKAMEHHSDLNTEWHKSLSGIQSDVPLIVVANEFLDVLPVRQYVKRKEDWLERCVTASDDKALQWVLSDTKLDMQSLPHGAENEPDGAVYEIASSREIFFHRAAEAIAQQGGAAIFIDYGHGTSGFGDTLQAMQNHKYVDPLEEPGAADITSHVDFEALEKAIADLDLHGHELMTQGEFLLALGLLERAGALGAGKSQAEQEKIQRQAERLALPTQMGDLFKVIGISSMKELTPFKSA